MKLMVKIVRLPRRIFFQVNAVITDYGIDLKKNFNVVTNDYGITDVYADVIKTHWFEYYFRFQPILVICFFK